MRLLFTWATFLVAAIFAALPYCSQSLFNYRFSERTLILSGPVVCLLCAAIALFIRGKLDKIVAAFLVCVVISLLPVVRVATIFLLWKIFGFGP